MAQVCRIFIKNMNVNLVPLYTLTKTNVDYIWSEECQIDKSYFIVEIDASDIGIGYCLKVLEDNQEL